MSKKMSVKRIITGLICTSLLIGSVQAVPVRADSSTSTTQKNKTVSEIKDTSGNTLFTMTTESDALNKDSVVDVSIKMSDTIKSKGFFGYFDYDHDVFYDLEVGNIKITDSGKETATAGWTKSYDINTNKLDVKNSSTAVTGAAISFQLKAKKAVASTKVKLDRLEIKSETGATQIPTPNSLENEMVNTAAKKLTLATNNVSGSTKLTVPFNITKNEGSFCEISVSAEYDSNVLKNPSFTPVSSVLTSTSNIESSKVEVQSEGTTAKATATYKLKSDTNITGALVNVNFEPVKAATSTPVVTTVVLSVDSAANQAKDVFALNRVASNVTITTSGSSSSSSTYNLGDVNNDGKIDLLDAVYVVRYYKKTRTLTDAEIKAADVNKNGTADLTDALQILRYYNGEIKSF